MVKKLIKSIKRINAETFSQKCDNDKNAIAFAEHTPTRDRAPMTAASQHPRSVFGRLWREVGNSGERWGWTAETGTVGQIQGGRTGRKRPGKPNGCGMLDNGLIAPEKPNHSQAFPGRFGGWG